MYRAGTFWGTKEILLIVALVTPLASSKSIVIIICLSTLSREFFPSFGRMVVSSICVYVLRGSDLGRGFLSLYTRYPKTSGFAHTGILSNMAVSRVLEMRKLVSALSFVVTRTEYLCATVRYSMSTSFGSVYIPSISTIVNLCPSILM